MTWPDLLFGYAVAIGYPLFMLLVLAGLSWLFCKIIGVY